MNPHSIFGSLGSLQSSVINDEPDKAVRYLSKFSKLMRNILDSSHEETISLKEELATIDNYLDLQKIRFPFNWPGKRTGTKSTLQSLTGRMTRGKRQERG